MQDILGGDGFAADAAFGKGHVLGDGFVEVVAHHEHVEVFLQRVHGEGARGVGGGGQHIVRATYFDDVGGVTAARAFGVKGMDGAPADGLHRVLDKAAFVEGVGVDHDLHVHVIGHGQAAINCAGGGAPILVQLEARRPALDHFAQGFGL